MAERKKARPQPLKIGGAVPVAEATDSPDGGGKFSVDTTERDLDAIEKSISSLELSEEQKGNMSSFLEDKRAIIRFGDLKEHDFERITELGSGNGGVVLKVKHTPSGITMARKIIMLDIKPAIRNQIMRELKVLHDCTSPYIVGFFGNFCINNEISICMQHMDGGSLDLIMNGGRIPVNVILKITLAVLNGLNYLREAHRIIHRDVKPSNILVNSRGEIKLCDFGVSGNLINSMANSFVGTRSYMAPERLQGNEYSILSDLWSLGMSLVEMALGRYPIPQPPSEEIAMEMKQPPAGTLPPRPNENPFASHAHAIRMPIFELLQIIFSSDPPTLPKQYFDESFRDFVSLCLQKEAKDRGEMKVLLEHPFIKSGAISSPDFAVWVQRTIEANIFYESLSSQ
ncbi:dual specificity mitogen-activated protein kinase kinase 1-like [Halichondria panicea]|uniref:dual specificity mitogen-activated protein kinase kinase 1-like n=1 Tax=Halichondria panicea TaxID=6063 RepID=UPI00312B978D